MSGLRLADVSPTAFECINLIKNPMATIKVKVRPSCVAGRAGTVYYQVIHLRRVRQITTRLRLHPDGWDAVRQRVRLPEVADIAMVQAQIDSDLDGLGRIVRDLERLSKETGKPFTVDEIVIRFRAPERHVPLAAFMAGQVTFLRQCGRLGTAVNYQKALECLLGFPGGNHLLLSELTAAWVDRYQDYLRQRGLTRNSISFHIRILRAVYNKAVRRGDAVQSFPFRDVFTGIDRTRKRAVGEAVIVRMAALDLTGQPGLELARDLFLFSFYTRGMSFVDMAYLRMENIEGDMLCYVRRKTGRTLCIRIEPCIRELLDRYADPARPWVFPVLKSDDPATAYARYRVALGYYNRLLKRISRLVGLDRGLSFYAARHSWATLARDRQVPISVISAGMGHSSERMTQIYLTSLENEVVDNANRRLLAAFGRRVRMVGT